MSNGEEISGIPVEVPPIDQKERGRLQAVGERESGMQNSLWAALWASIVSGLTVVITLAVGAFDNILSIIGDFVFAAQAEKTEGFANLTGAILSDLLGVEVPKEKLQDARAGGGRIAFMTAVGSQLLDLLACEFTQKTGAAGGECAAGARGTGIGGLPDAQVTPETGVEAARRLLGFVMSYAVREGNISVFTDALSFHFLEHYRDFGSNLARNLGLGRLTRLALRSFIKGFISDPLAEAFNMQYRPTKLTAAEAVKSWIAGGLTLEQRDDALARAGYNGELFQALNLIHGRGLTERQILALVSAGKLEGEALERRLAELGLRFSDRELFQTADQVERTQAAAKRILDVSLRQLLEGVIPIEDFNERLTRFDPGEGSRELLQGIANELLSRPRRRLSLAQMRTAFKNATIDAAEFDDFLRAQGYSQTDRTILTIETLLEAGKAAEHAKAKEAKPSRRAAPTGTAPPAGERRGRPTRPTMG